jgi:hypothetical protein
MKSVTTGFLLLLIKIFLTSNLFAQEKNDIMQKGFVAIAYGDIGFERPLKEWTINELNSANLKWSYQNDWSLRCLGLIEAPFSGEITIYTEADNYIRININGKKIIEAEKLEKTVREM